MVLLRVPVSVQLKVGMKRLAGHLNNILLHGVVIHNIASEVGLATSTHTRLAVTATIHWKIASTDRFETDRGLDNLAISAVPHNSSVQIFLVGYRLSTFIHKLICAGAPCAVSPDSEAVATIQTFDFC